MKKTLQIILAFVFLWALNSHAQTENDSFMQIKKDFTESSFTSKADCPPGTITSNPPDGGWALTSSQNQGTINYLHFDSDLIAEGSYVGGFLLWGLQAFHDGTSWAQCLSDFMDFHVAFYEDDNGEPGDLIYEETVTASAVVTTNVSFGTWTVKRFAINLTQAVEFHDGYVSIASANAPTCWFLGISTATGLANSYIYDTAGNFVQRTTNDGPTGISYCVIESLPTSEVTFTVTDQLQNPIEGASVTVTEVGEKGNANLMRAIHNENLHNQGRSRLSTNENGQAMVELPDGNYQYTVTKPDYTTVVGNFTVDGDDLNIDVTLKEVFEVVFNVDMSDVEGFEPDQHSVYLTGTFTGWAEPGTEGSISMERIGSAIFEEHFGDAIPSPDLPVGWEVKKADNPLGNNLQDLAEDDQRWIRYSAEYFPYGTFNPDWIYSGEAAMHCNWNVENEQNVYAISPLFEIPEADFVELEYWKVFEHNFASNWITEYNVLLELNGEWELLQEFDGDDGINVYDEPVLIDLTGKQGTARIAFVLKWSDGYQMTIDAITVTAYDNANPDHYMYTSTANISTGEAEYKYFSDAWGAGWDGGEWPGDPTRIITVEEDMIVNDVWGTIFYTVTFEVEDQEGDLITDAVIELGPFTNEAGDYVFEFVPWGMHDYTVTADAYFPFSGSIDVQGDVTINVVLDLEVYTVTFAVKDEDGEDIKNAVIVLGPFNDNEAGDYVFPDAPPGVHEYLVTAPGYVDAAGVVTVTNDDVDVDITMVEAIVYTVEFEVVGHNGTLIVTVDDVAITSGDEVAHESEIVFTATPDTGYEIKEWTLNGEVFTDGEGDVVTLASWKLVLEEDVTVTVEFELIPFMLDVVVVPGPEAGMIEFDPEQDYYFMDQEVTLTAVATGTFTFQNWRDVNNLVIGSDEVLVYTMPADDVQLFAHFTTSPTFTVSLDAYPAEGGEVFGAGNFVEGETVTVEAVANDGFYFVKWTAADDVVPESELPVYTFDMPAATVTMTAHFDPFYTVTFDVVDEDGAAIDDASITLGAITNALGNYVFENVPAGYHEYIVIATGYVNVEGTAEVVDEDVHINVTMTPFAPTEPVLVLEQPIATTGMTGATSANRGDINYEVADNFSNLDATVNQVVFYGLYAIFDGGWGNVDPGDELLFNIRFYAAAAEQPDWNNPVEEYLNVPTVEINPQTPWGNGFNVWEYVVDIPDTYITNGWISIQSSGGNGWFLWHNGTGGDAYAFQHNHNAKGLEFASFGAYESTKDALEYDLAMKLYGTLGEMFTITFTVADQFGEPLEGATVLVSLDDKSVELPAMTREGKASNATPSFTRSTTDENGQVTFDLPAGDYNYTASKAGYTEAAGTFTVDDEDVDIEVMLTELYEVAFNVDMSDVDGFDPDQHSVYLTGSFTGWTEPGEPGSIEMSTSVPILHEAFLDAEIPAGWTILDEDGDGEAWFIVPENHGPIEGNYAIASASWDFTAGPLTPDNWLITPQITDVNDDYVLSFFVKAQDASWPQEKYDVLISTTGTDPADFTSVWSETLTDGLWQERSVALEDFAGEDIYIAFRHWDCTDWFRLVLDVIKVEGTPVGTEHMYKYVATLPYGTHEYKYFSDAWGAGWEGGEWHGDPNRELNVTGNMDVNDIWGEYDPEPDPEYIVTFHVSDTDGINIDHASITLGAITNALGNYVFENVPAGYHEYIVVATGYVNVEGTAEVVDEDVHINVTMTPFAPTEPVLVLEQPIATTGMTGATSANRGDINYEVADNFSNLDATVNQVVFYGLYAIFDGGWGWGNVDPGDELLFNIRFYAAAAEQPDWNNPVEEYLNVPTVEINPQTPWGNGFNVWEYVVDIPDTYITNGWISIQSSGGNGWFLWHNGTGGDAYAYQHDHNAKGLELASIGAFAGAKGPLNYDLAMKLYGTSGEMFMVTFEIEDSYGNPVENAIITIDGTEYAAGEYIFELLSGAYQYQIHKTCYLTVGDLLFVSSDMNVIVVLENLYGDANGDGSVDVLDVISMANYYIGVDVDPFCFNNADVNGDGVIDALDVIATINLFISGKTAPYQDLLLGTAHLYLHPEGIYIESDGTLAGLQFEVTGNFLQAMDLKLVLPDHQMVYAVDNNVMRVMIFSLDNTPIPAGTTGLVMLNTPEGLLQFGEALAGNLNAEKVELVTHNYDATSAGLFSEDAGLRFYPNPASGELFVTFTHAGNAPAVLSLVNLHGQRVLAETLMGRGHHETVLSLEGLTPGVYMLQLELGNRLFIEKLVIK